MNQLDKQLLVQCSGINNRVSYLYKRVKQPIRDEVMYPRRFIEVQCNAMIFGKFIIDY